MLFAYSKCEPGMTRGLNSDCMWIILDGIEPAIITFQIRAQFECHVVFIFLLGRLPKCCHRLLLETHAVFNYKTIEREKKYFLTMQSRADSIKKYMIWPSSNI